MSLLHTVIPIKIQMTFFSRSIGEKNLEIHVEAYTHTHIDKVILYKKNWMEARERS